MAAVRERTSGARMQGGRGAYVQKSTARVQKSTACVQKSTERVQKNNAHAQRSSAHAQKNNAHAQKSTAQSGMSMRSGSNTQSRRSQQSGGRTHYIQGSAVRKLDVTREIEQSPKKKLSNTARKNREKAEHMSLGYVLFLSAALFATGCILVGYIGLQSDITNSIKRIAALEGELNDLKLANDEEYNRITSSIDLEEVRRIAIQELGMQYAEEGQIVVFQSENNDYVKQVAPIPD